MSDRWLLDPRRGLIELYHRAEVLNAELDRIRQEGGDVVRIDAGRWDASTHLASIADALGFPGHFGGNLDALADCLGDVVAGAYGFRADAIVRALAIYQFDSFHRAAPAAAGSLLDVLGEAAILGLRASRPLIVLLQSDDPQLRLGPVAPMVVTWNQSEFGRDRRS